MTGPENGLPASEGVDDPALWEVAEQVKAVLHLPQSRVTPEFRAGRREELRAQLIAARAEAIATRPTERPTETPAPTPAETPAETPPVLPIARPSVPTPRSGGARLRRRPVAVWVGGLAAAATLGVAVLVNGLPFGPSAVNVTALSELAGSFSANPAAALRVRFSQALDHAATEAALKIAPAASIRWSWQGDTLTGSPVHGFAPNVAYLLTIDRKVARTAAGAPLADDLRVAFGTAPTVAEGPPAAKAVPLERTVLAAAAEGSEAVVANDDSVLLTGATAGPATGYRAGLVRLHDGTARRLESAADGICASRSGNSIAYLVPSRSGNQIVFADGAGIPTGRVTLKVDQGSPLGWIDDQEVSFVAGGRLQAVDRAGHVRALSGVSVNADRDRIVISPGGRYVYLAQGPTSTGRLFDLHTGASHLLPGILGDPAFSADGGTAVWIDRTHGTAWVAIGSSGGGPVLNVPLPVGRGDQVSDLAISPNGSQLVYSLTRADGHSELRLASLPDGDTLAVSTSGAGESPNWAPSGRRFTVLAHRGSSARIESIAVPHSTLDRQAQLEATVSDFASAQLSADSGAQRSLAAPGTTFPAIPQVTRAATLWVRPGPDGTASARVRLTIDPGPAHPVTQQAEETLTLTLGSGQTRATVQAVSAGPFGPAPAGPQLQHLDTDAVPGAAVLTFDSDLDPASVTGAAKLTGPDGTAIAATLSYDPAARTLTVRPKSGGEQPLVVRVGTGLRDVAGTALSAPIQVEIGPLVNR